MKVELKELKINYYIKVFLGWKVNLTFDPALRFLLKIEKFSIVFNQKIFTLKNFRLCHVSKVKSF